MKLGLRDKVLGGEEEKTELARRAEAFSEQDLIRYFDLLLRLESDIKWTSQPRFHLEIGLVKLAKAAHIRDIEEVLRDLKQGPAGPSSSSREPAGQTARPVQPAQAENPRRAASAPPTRPAPQPPPAPKPPAPQAPSRAAAATAAQPGRADDSALSSAREEPLVRRFLEVFRGDIAQVKPSKGETQ